LVLGPVHYVAQACVLALAGGQAAGLVTGGAVEQALAVLLTYAVCRELDASPARCLVFASLPLVGGVAIMGYPVYDIDACLLALVAIWAVMVWERRGYGTGAGLAAGALAGLVALAKFNIGLPLFAGLALACAAAALLYARFPGKRSMLLAAGALLLLGAFVALLLSWGALDRFIEQTISG